MTPVPFNSSPSDRLGYDGAGRPITKRYLASGINGGSHAYNNPTSVVGFTTAYDRASNKFYERHLHAESRSHLYEPYIDGAPSGGYDSLDRLRQYQRGILSTTGGFSNAGGGSITTPISLPGTDEFRTYDLDGLGNWRRTSFEPVGDDEETEIRQHNGLNQITRIDNTPFEYDGIPGASNGNLTNDGIRKYEWDALNRLIKVYKTPDTPVLIGEYVYDALNRRIRKTVSNGGFSGTIPNGTADFIYNPSWQCVEERDNSNDPTKQYIWGIYIDELLQQKTYVAINGNDPGDYYPLSDLLYRTTALTDDSGNIVEACDCDAYGNTLIFTAAGTGDDWWADDAVIGDVATCAYIFTGRQYDLECSLYYFRFRVYASKYGRFLGKDPLTYNEGMNLFNSYFVPKGLDPSGLGDYANLASLNGILLARDIPNRLILDLMKIDRTDFVQGDKEFRYNYITGYISGGTITVPASKFDPATGILRYDLIRGDLGHVASEIFHAWWNQRLNDKCCDWLRRVHQKLANSQYSGATGRRNRSARDSGWLDQSADKDIAWELYEEALSETVDSIVMSLDFQNSFAPGSVPPGFVINRQNQAAAPLHDDTFLDSFYFHPRSLTQKKINQTSFEVLLYTMKYGCGVPPGSTSTYDPRNSPLDVDKNTEFIINQGVKLGF